MVVSHHRWVPMEPFSPFDPYSGGSPPATMAGHLLVATPAVDDPNFWRRVILVIDHGEQGALGVALDRPSGVAVGAVLPRWQDVVTAPDELFVGGPVSRNSMIGMVRLRRRSSVEAVSPELPVGWKLVVDDERPLGMVDLSADPTTIAGSLSSCRIFSGYAGWGPGQLEDEIDDGSWYVVPAEARDPISADPEGLWRRVLRRQGGALALVASFPADPSAN